MRRVSFHVTLGIAHQHADPPHPLGLRARGERPRTRAAEQRDELGRLHSITSSALASRDGRHVETESSRGLKVDHQLVLGRRLHRHVRGLLALEDAVDVAGRLSVLVDQIRSI